MADVAKFIEEIKSLTVLELNELVKAMKKNSALALLPLLWWLVLPVPALLLPKKRPSSTLC